jgi:hypothetical protein
MTVSQLSSSSTSPSYALVAAGSNPVAQDWKDLQSAIGQDNMQAAQTAFDSLQKDLASSPTGSPSANSPVGQALSQLQTAIQSGSASASQSAFHALRSAVRGMHHHQHTSGGYASNSSTSSSGGSGISLITVAAPGPAQGSVGSQLNVLA